MQTFSIDLAGRPFTVEIGKFAQLANASCMVRYGDTTVLVAVTVGEKPRDGVDFFPLSVDYEERLYAVGKIPGSFMKREGRPSEKAILTSRLIDRPIRPLFPKDFRHDVCINAMVLSVEIDNSPEVAAMIGAGIALGLSNLPFRGPIGSIFIGYVDGEYVVNPTLEQRERSTLQLSVAGTRERVNMIEAGALEVSDDVMYDGIMLAHEEIKRICDFIDHIADTVGRRPVMQYNTVTLDEALVAAIAERYTDDIKVGIDTNDKTIRDENLRNIKAKIVEELTEQFPETASNVDAVVYQLEKKIVRAWLLEGKRVDGRGIDEMRPLSAEVGLLRRVHGSGMFTRGQTQVMSVATLGAMGDVQKLDGLDEDENKRYMHHYNFPSFSVGEARPSRGPGRREIGHGALAERALEPVLPSEEAFPFAIRVVSEVLSSNGSTSQASICGSSLALMDAGVPIKAAVAGISVGLIEDGDRFIEMLDIQGIEDFFGDMDFKVAGTLEGITAIQMDLKVDGLTPPMIREALTKTRIAREKIIKEVMSPVIPEPRAELSEFAPRLYMMTIPVDKIREVIGPGGKVIQRIIADTGVKIDIEDDGRVNILSQDQAAGQQAIDIINSIVKDPEVGDVYSGRVIKILPFGAVIEIKQGKEGLLHISRMDYTRVEKVEDICNVGDTVTVKVVEIEPTGRINLSRKDTLPVPEGYVERPERPRPPRDSKPRDDRRDGGRDRDNRRGGDDRRRR